MMNMKKNNTFDEIWSKLKSAERVIMSLHDGPDGDGLGSCTAMKYVLEKHLGLKVILISPDNLDGVLMDLPFCKEVEFGKKFEDLSVNKEDILLFLDSGEISYYKNPKKEGMIKGRFVINMDHHITNTFYGNLNYVDVNQPSACSILVDFFRKKNINFDRELSKRLLLGICTDSGFFKHGNVNKSLKDALFLIENGADYTNDIINPILNNQPLKMKRYYALLINNLKVNKRKRFAYSSIAYRDIKKLGLNLAEVRLGPGHLNDIKELDFIFTLAEMEDHIKGSFRSKVNIDVSLFAKALSGGGHRAAAAFRLPKMSLKKAENKVIKTIGKVGINRY